MFVRFCFPSTYMRLHVNHFPVPPKPVSGARFFRYKVCVVSCFSSRSILFCRLCFPRVCLLVKSCEQYLVYTAQLSKMGSTHALHFVFRLVPRFPRCDRDLELGRGA